MPSECCVPQCTNRKGGHSFPFSRKEQVKAWLVAIRRDHWKPTKHSVVCSSHFDEGDYVQKTTSGTKPLQKKLKASAVPHIFNWTLPESSAAIKRKERLEQRRAKKTLLPKTESELSEEVIIDWSEMDIGCEQTVTSYQSNEPAVPTTPMTATTQTEPVITRDSSTQSADHVLFSCQQFVNDPKGIHFYTGLENYSTFTFVLQTLGPAAYHLNYYNGFAPDIDVEDQFFMTLMKLRRHTTNFELSRLFKLSESGVTNVFVTWVNFMFHQWNEIDWWPSREVVHFFAPSDFHTKFPNTRVVIDGTECPIQKPKQPLAQQSTFSTYKNKNTVKVLVGGTPGGLVSYVSDAYGGSTSDRQICERSGLTTMCEPGDSIMADKGFNVQDLFESKNIVINIPSFFKAKNRMSAGTVLSDRKIASKRVHIERLIGLAKTYKILKEDLNNTESSLATEILTICFTLCNFRNGIVPKHA